MENDHVCDVFLNAADVRVGSTSCSRNGNAAHETPIPHLSSLIKPARGNRLLVPAPLAWISRSN